MKTSLRSVGVEDELEATTGFEPVDGGFADPCLTTWLRRRISDSSILDWHCQKAFVRVLRLFLTSPTLRAMLMIIDTPLFDRRDDRDPTAFELRHM
jgi:hypothetical protein